MQGIFGIAPKDMDSISLQDFFSANLKPSIDVLERISFDKLFHTTDACMV